MIYRIGYAKKVLNMSNSLPLALDSRGVEVKDLQSSLAKIGYILPNNELDEQAFGIGTQDALLKLQAKYGLSRTGILNDATKAALVTAVATA
jgi:hypothetical protein